MATVIPFRPPTDEPDYDDAPMRDDDGQDSIVENGLELPDQGQEDPLAQYPDLQHKLYELYKTCCEEDRYSRLVEVKDVKQAEFYWDGRQYIWWSDQDKSWQLPSQAQAVSYSDLDIDDMPRFEYVTNIYQSRGLGVIGATSTVPPRWKFFPDDADDADDIETADQKSKGARLIYKWNPIQVMMQDEVYHGYTGGFVCWYTRYVADGSKYGTDSVSNIGTSTIGGDDETIVCPECGWSSPAEYAEPPVPCPVCNTVLTVEDLTSEPPIEVPSDTDSEDAPKGRVIIGVYGALNCKRPQHVNKQSQYHYFGIEEEVHYSILRAAFPSKARLIAPGGSMGAEDVYERNARLSVSEHTKLLTQTGSSQSKLCTYARVWFRPSAFYMLDSEQAGDDIQERDTGDDKGAGEGEGEGGDDGDGNGNDVPETDTEILLRIFPRGCRVELSGDVYLTSAAESMDKVITTCHAMPGRGQHRNGIGTSLMSVQDRINTCANIEMETYEYGIPITYRASDTFNSDANADQRAAPGLEVEVNLPAGQDIRSKVYQVRADSVSPTMQTHQAALMGPVADELVGTHPAATGAASDNSPETGMQHAMQRDAAMGRMGVFYMRLKQAHADLTTQAVEILEENIKGPEKNTVLNKGGDFETETVDPLALQGSAKAYPEGDENYPILWSQKRQVLMEIMDHPLGMELAKDPENQELIISLLGIDGLKSPVANAWRKQLREIKELTKQPDEDDVMMGIAPGAMVAVDPLNDLHPIEEACCSWWLNCPLGQRMKEFNPGGWQAVSVHRQQHLAAVPKPEPAKKPLGESLNIAFKDMGPEAQAQVLEQLGIHVTPQDFIAKLMLDKAAKEPAKGGPNGEPGADDAGAAKVPKSPNSPPKGPGIKGAV